MKHKNTLSFEVIAIRERRPYDVSIFDTKLRLYTTGETITVRGKPWKVGSKIDFAARPAADAKEGKLL